MDHERAANLIIELAEVLDVHWGDITDSFDAHNVVDPPDRRAIEVNIEFINADKD